MPSIYIILVNYNQYGDTINCIKSLEETAYKNFKIIVIDNKSENDSIKFLEKACKKHTLINLSKNLGFAGGNNVGIKYALKKDAQYILLLNNDTIVNIDFIKPMLETFDKHSDCGIVGNKIMYYNPKNMIWFAGGKIDWRKFIGYHFGIGEIDKGQYDKEGKIDFMTGCCMLIKREVFEKVGLLPEEYFMYFEDLDFCVNVQNFGFKIYYNPKSVIYHKVGNSGGGEQSVFSIKWGTRNRLLFANKYKNKVKKIKFIYSMLFFYSTRIIKYIGYYISGEKDKAKAVVDGIIEAKNIIKNIK